MPFPAICRAHRRHLCLTWFAALVVSVAAVNAGHVDASELRRTALVKAIERAVRARDHDTCTFPGCHNRRFLQCHHVEHWARGGDTSVDNLLLLCTKHHSLVHEGGFRSVRYRRRCSLPVH